jgi:hypothetical protein
MFGAVLGESHPQPPIRRLDPLDVDTGAHADPDTLALGVKARHCVGVHRRQQLWQRLEDCDVGAGTRIHMSKFQRNHSAADENHRARLLAFAQDLVRGHQVLAAGNRQRSRLRSCRDHDVSRFEQTFADADRIRRDEGCLSRDDLDLAFDHRAGKVLRDVLDQVLLAVDQGGPVELRLADRDVVNTSAVDLVQGVARGHQDLLRRAATVRAGTAEIAGLDHRDRQAGAPDRTGCADAGIAAAQDHHVEFFGFHRGCLARCRVARCTRAIRRAGAPCYLALMVDVIELTTIVAILNCAARSVML